MMKNRGTILGAAILCLSLSASAAEKMYGVFMVVKGKVEIKDEKGANSAAKVGTKIYEGQSVQTKADSRAKIVMSDRNVLNVSPDTDLKISKYENDAASGKKNVELNLASGKVRSNVEQTYEGKNKFEVKTPTAVAGVRGTQFLTGFDVKTQATTIVTFKGSVTLASVSAAGTVGSAVTVSKGQTSSASGGSAPEAPKSVPKSDMKKMEGESTVSMSKDAGAAAGAGTAGSGSSSSSRDPAQASTSAETRPDTSGKTVTAVPVPKAPELPASSAPAVVPKVPTAVPAVDTRSTKTKVIVRPVIQ